MPKVQLTITSEEEGENTISLTETEHELVKYKGDGSAILNLPVMTVGHPYSVLIGGEWLVVRKNQSGEVSFFSIPEYNENTK